MRSDELGGRQRALEFDTGSDRIDAAVERLEVRGRIERRVVMLDLVDIDREHQAFARLETGEFKFQPLSAVHHFPGHRIDAVLRQHGHRKRLVGADALVQRVEQQIAAAIPGRALVEVDHQTR